MSLFFNCLGLLKGFYRTAAALGMLLTAFGQG